MIIIVECYMYITIVDVNRAPSIPLECFHGNCYSDKVEVLREGGVIAGLKLILLSDGGWQQVRHVHKLPVC